MPAQQFAADNDIRKPLTVDITTKQMPSDMTTALQMTSRYQTVNNKMRAEYTVTYNNTIIHFIETRL